MSRSIAFGPFVMAIGERVLLRDGLPVPLGARAFDILAALASHPHEVLGKNALLAQVWPDTIVEEGALRFHVANLRRALGDGKNGARYIVTLPGRGYCFVAAGPDQAGSQDVLPGPSLLLQHANLPARLARLVGRSEDVATIATQLHAGRLVTVVGPGGIGKTVVAIALGHDLVALFAGHVHLVDLGVIDDPHLVATTVAAMLGLTPDTDDAIPGLAAFLAGRPCCLILDTCEHVLDAAAALASALLAALPDLRLVATSREPLCIAGEHVHRLVPLAFPSEEDACCLVDMHRFPAVQLFIERAVSAGGTIGSGDVEHALAAAICRRLEGIPLAIEVAASRVPTFGLQGVATMLADTLPLSWQGARDAPARQRSLQATLAWSYDLLSHAERDLLQRLVVFVSHFAMSDALAVVPDPTLDAAAARQALHGLVSKSLLATRPAGTGLRYRMLDTTRAFAEDRRAEHADGSDGLTTRHAAHCLTWLQATHAAPARPSTTLERSRHLAGLANVRAALERCFTLGGDASMGNCLVAAFIPVLRSMSLLAEVHRWEERAAAFEAKPRV